MEIPPLVFDDECYCKCHSYTNVRHIQACCYHCEICYKNIEEWVWDTHRKQHKDNPVKDK